MKTLSAENEARGEARLERARLEHLAPALCDADNCREQLHYTSPGTILTTDPPMQAVHCPECGSQGFLYT